MPADYRYYGTGNDSNIILISMLAKLIEQHLGYNAKKLKFESLRRMQPIEISNQKCDFCVRIT